MAETENEYVAWKKQLQRLKVLVTQGRCKDSDGAGAFLANIRDFLIFILGDGKEKEYREVIIAVHSLGRFCSNSCSLDGLPKKQEETLDSCIKICEKFED